MYRPTLVIMLVLGFLIAYQIVNPYRTQVCHFWEMETCVVGYCVVRDATETFDALYPCLLNDFS